MTTKANLNGRQQGEKNLKRFTQWIRERRSVNDWSDYIRSGKLNRTEIASECGFDRAAFRQNPALGKLLSDTEEELNASGFFTGPGDFPVSAENTTTVATKRLILATKNEEQRLKHLEEQNASLRAEVGVLRDKLTQYQMIDEHLAQTGRLLLP